VNFIWDNIFLICVVLYCTGALIWPYVRRSARITSTEATQMINKGKVAIIDVRDQADFKSGHLLNAIHVPLDTLGERLPKLEKLKKQPVIVIDKTGKQSRAASRALRDAGFAQVYSLTGGMDEWKKKGLPVTM